MIRGGDGEGRIGATSGLTYVTASGHEDPLPYLSGRVNIRGTDLPTLKYNVTASAEK